MKHPTPQTFVHIVGANSLYLIFHLVLLILTETVLLYRSGRTNNHVNSCVYFRRKKCVSYALRKSCAHKAPIASGTIPAHSHSKRLRKVYLVHLEGLEPPFTVSKTVVLAIGRQMHLQLADCCYKVIEFELLVPFCKHHLARRLQPSLY